MLPIVMVPDPVPDAPDKIMAHDAFVDAVHAHPLGASTLKLSCPLYSVVTALVGETVRVLQLPVASEISVKNASPFDPVADALAVTGNAPLFELPVTNASPTPSVVTAVPLE